MKGWMVAALCCLPLVLYAQKRAGCCAPSAPAEFAMLADDPAFVRAQEEPTPFHFVATRGQMVTFPTADSLKGRGFDVRPLHDTQNLILLVHEWWGLNDYIRREAERLQKDLGDVRVLAVDLYDGKIATSREQAAAFMGGARDERVRAILKGAIAYAGKGARIGTIGWCFGGGWSMQASLLAGPQAAACVLYYGMPVSDTAALATLHAPVLGIFGTRDAWITPAVVDTFAAAMKAAGKSLTVHEYDAEHAFANPSNPKHDTKATGDAYQLTIRFFRTYLLPQP